MATRTVTVRLRADINQYTRGMRQAADSTSRLAGAGAAVGTAMVTGFAIAAASAAKFDKALSNVRAVTGASSAEMAKLRAAALEAGKTTSFTATEAANAEAELARAGVKVSDITGGALKGTLALAASGQMDLADSAVIAAQAMNTFGLSGKDVTHVADVLSAAANKSAADMSGLGMSLRQGGLLAKQTGLSFEDTVGTLAAFADHALIGSDAGTSLKTMLQRLTPQSVEARTMMDKLGFTAYDSQGKFVGLTKLAGNLQNSFKNLTPEARNAAFATIFGSDAVRSATILYELGAGGIQKYTKAVNDQGAAGRMAAIQTDNLIGDLERLRGAIEVALIEGGSSANGALRTMTQWVTNLVNAYNDLPPGLQHAVTLLTGVGGAATLAVTGFLLLVPRIAATRTALASMGVTATRARGALAAVGKVSAVIGALSLLSMATNQLKQELKGTAPGVSEMSQAVIEFGKSGKVSGALADQYGKDLSGLTDEVSQLNSSAADNGFVKFLDQLGAGFGLFGDTEAQTARNAISGFDEALSNLVSSGHADQAAAAFEQLAIRQKMSVEDLRDLMPQYTESLAGADLQAKTMADGQGILTEATEMSADALQDQRTEAEKLSEALNNLNGTAISAAESEIGFRQSLADLSQAVKDNGTSLDVSTEKGRAVKGAFLDAAKAAQDHAQAVAEQTDSQAAGQKVLETDIGLLKRQMEAAHFSKDAIENLIGSFAQMPPAVETKVDAKTASAMSDLEAVKTKVATMKGKTITMAAPTAAARAQLEALGFKIKNTKGKQVIITVPTGGQKRAVDALAAAIRALRDKSVSVTTTFVTRGTKSAVAPAHRDYGAQADGSILSFYANGGVRENHVAQIARKGSWRVWAEDEAGDEAYIPLNPAKRSRSRMIAAETVKRLGGQVAWFANGGIPGFTYTPTGMPVLGGPSDAKSRYDQEITDLKKAWDDLNKALKDQKKAADNLRSAEKNLASVRKGHHTAAQLRSAQERVTKARSAKRSADSTVAKERKDVYAADAELGLKKGAKAPGAFNLRAYETQLNESVAATLKWRASLTKIGQRGGKELQAMLEGMGEEGYALVNALAGASDKQFKSIVSKLEKTGDIAKATLADFTKQLGASTKESQQFAADLQKLAASGFGDLAQALAAQGDASAMALAHQAVGSPAQAAAANKAVTTAQGSLTGDDLTNALTLLSTLRGGTGRGFADLIAAGLDVATIRALVPKMTAQIKALPAANKDTFVRQWNQQGGVAMAAGGILTRPTMVLGGEAGDVESWIPWNGSARSRALLGKTAAAMGYQLTPAGRYGGGASVAAVAREVTKQITVNLYGAKQSTAEQAMDVARHMSFVG